MSEGFGVIPNWLVRDTSISGAAKMVYVVLSSHAGVQGTTWLSHATIAAESGTSVSSVQRALSALVGLGLVKISPRRREDGGQTSNLYRIEAHVPLGQSDRPPRSEGPTPPVRVTDEEEPLKKNPLRTPALVRRGRTTTRAEYTPEFEEFWSIYPRKEGKQAAARAFAKIQAHNVDIQAVITGAKRYRDDRNREAAYTKHASTWLNADCWLDLPLPARTTRMSANDAVAQTLDLAGRLAGRSPTTITGAGPWGQIGAGT